MNYVIVIASYTAMMSNYLINENVNNYITF